MNYDEDYVKDLERQIERQQEQVDKYSMFIKRLDGLNIKMSMQDCSQFIKPEAFIRWLERSSTWKLNESFEDHRGVTKKFLAPNGRQISILVKCRDKSFIANQQMDLIEAFHHVWDMWLYDHKGKGVISLIIDIMEYEDE